MAAPELLVLSAVMALVAIGVLAWIAREVEWRRYVPATGDGGGFGESVTRHEREKPAGVTRWLTTVDHKDIGLLYVAFSLFALLWAGIAVLLMRLELMTPATDLLTIFGGARTYNALLTTHGITMLFLFGTPVIAAFGNYFVPLLIGADDMAFPRVNAIAFWLLPPGALLVWSGFFLHPLTDGAVAAAQTSWTLYTPLSVEQAAGTAGPNPGADLMLLGLHVTGVSATMGAINFIATIFTERGDDVSWANLDIFSWTVLAQSGIILFAFPLLGSAAVMLLMDRNLGTTFYAVEGGGPILWQHLFWFFGHPEVYILVLPPMGVVSLLVPRFSDRELFGFKFVVYSTLAIAVLSFGVWGHHLFATGADPRLRASFMAVSLAIAVPSAVKTFNWITTMWNGRLRLTVPMLFCIGFVSNFIIGGITGVFLAAVPIDLLVHDTYYVVGHFHYMLMGGTAFAVFGAIYYWFPLVTGRWYQTSLARWHFWLTFVGTNLTFFAMMVLGYMGMPRRYASYDAISVGPLDAFTTLHGLTSLGAILLTIGGLVFGLNLVQSALEGTRVEDGDPWNLRDAELYTREWSWFEDNRLPAVADGGSEQEGDAEN